VGIGGADNVIDSLVSVDEGVGANVDPHLLHPLALHFEDKGLPSRHLVTPSTQYTPPCREQHPLQSAYTVVVTVVRKIVNSMDMNTFSFFILLSMIHTIYN